MRTAPTRSRDVLFGAFAVTVPSGLLAALAAQPLPAGRFRVRVLVWFLVFAGSLTGGVTASESFLRSSARRRAGSRGGA